MSTIDRTQKNYLTIGEVCQTLKIARSMLYKLWARDDGPRRIKLGSRTLIREDDLHLWMSQHYENL